MKYTIMMGCGHEDTVELLGKADERERKIEYFRSYGLCKECYKKQMEEKAQKEGFVFNASVLPYIDNDDGSILLSVWFSGNTKPHKDDIKSLRGYAWRERESAADFYSIAAPSMCWNKVIKLADLKEEITKATSIGAEHTISDTGLFAMINYQIALEQHKKWLENKEKVNNIIKPSVPDVLKGHKWNQKIYGKPGNYSIYPDGEKVLITDEQANEIRNYITLKDEYKKKVEEIKNA